MKTRNVANYLIATTVILCSLVLCSTLVFALTGFRVGESQREIQIDFKDVTGIGPGTSVMYAGSPAGRVVDIRHLTPTERRDSGDPRYVVRVTAEIDEGIPALTQDVRSGIATDSFLGDKFIALLPGALDATPLAAGDVLRTTETPLMEMVQNVGGNIDKIVARLGDDYQKLIPQITELLERTGNMVDSGSGLVANLNGAVTNVQDLTLRLKTDYQGSYNPQLLTILDQVQLLTTNLNLTVNGVNTNATATINELRVLLEGNRTNLTEMIGELRVVSQNLKVISTYTKALTGRLGEKPSRMIWSRKKDLPTEAEIIKSKEPVEVPLGEE